MVKGTKIRLRRGEMVLGKIDRRGGTEKLHRGLNEREKENLKG